MTTPDQTPDTARLTPTHLNPEKPVGELCLQTITMPKDANYQGDIFGGWVVSQMDLAGAVLTHRIARGRVATVAMNDVLFKLPVAVGDICSCYASLIRQGNTSITVAVHVWACQQHAMDDKALAASAIITYVAIDENNRPRLINSHP